MTNTNTPKSVYFTHVGGPTAIIEIGGVRIITDPTFDPPGDHPVGDRVLTKLIGPAISLKDALPLDVVLLSHDQHPDNLDTTGRELLTKVPLVLTTSSAHKRLEGHTQALANWKSAVIPRRSGDELVVTGVPALHGPEGADRVAGEVTGFIISSANLPTIYVSGDNASLDIVRLIRERIGRIDIALLFAGAAKTALLPGSNLTLTSDDTAEATQILGVSYSIPLHFDGWAHFTEGKQALRAAFAKKSLTERLHLLTPGERTRIEAV